MLNSDEHCFYVSEEPSLGAPRVRASHLVLSLPDPWYRRWRRIIIIRWRRLLLFWDIPFRPEWKP